MTENTSHDRAQDAAFVLAAQFLKKLLDAITVG